MIGETLPFLGGAEVHTYALSKYLNEHNHEVYFITRNGAPRKTYDTFPFHVLPYPAIRKKGALCVSANIVSACITIFRLGMYKKVDLIHLHETQMRLACLFAKTLFRRPLIVTLHGNDIRNPDKQKVQEIVGKLILNSASKVICVSEELKDMAVSRGVDENKAIVIQNGIDVLRYSNTKPCKEIRKKIGEKSIIVMYLGRIVPEKGVDIIIEAAKKIADKNQKIKFVICGYGSEENKLKNRVLQYKLENTVSFLGKIDNESAPSYLKAADIFVSHFRLTHAGIGINILEAMACSLPVIVGRNKETLKDIEKNGAGLTVDCENPSELANAILRLAKNKKTRGNMGKNGHNLVSSKYNLNTKFKEVEKAYREFLNYRR